MRSGRAEERWKIEGKKDKMSMCMRERERNVEGLWVDKENAIYNGRGSGIDQNDCVL